MAGLWLSSCNLLETEKKARSCGRVFPSALTARSPAFIGAHRGKTLYLLAGTTGWEFYTWTVGDDDCHLLSCRWSTEGPHTTNYRLLLEATGSGSTLSRIPILAILPSPPPTLEDFKALIHLIASQLGATATGNVLDNLPRELQTPPALPAVRPFIQVVLETSQDEDEEYERLAARVIEPLTSLAIPVGMGRMEKTSVPPDKGKEGKGGIVEVARAPDVVEKEEAEECLSPVYKINKDRGSIKRMAGADFAIDICHSPGSLGDAYPSSMPPLSPGLPKETERPSISHKRQRSIEEVVKRDNDARTLSVV